MKNILLFLTASLLALLLAEIILQRVSPPMLLGVGSDKTRKASIYGWSAPEGLTRQMDPDTRQVFSFRSNSEGWKDVEHQRDKPAGVFRILVVGDSHTYTLVPIEHMYTRRLQAILRERGFDKVEVITLAMGAWGADQKLMALEHEGFSYQPDLVIYQFAANDIGDNLGWGTGARKPYKYEVTPRGLVKRSNPRIKPVSVIDKLKYGFISQSAIGYNLYLLRNQLRSAATPTVKPPPPGAAETPRANPVNATGSPNSARTVKPTGSVKSAQSETSTKSPSPRLLPGFEDAFDERIARHVESYLRTHPHAQPPMSFDTLLRVCRGSRMTPGSAYFYFAVGEHNEYLRRGWQLEKAILMRMKRLSEAAGAELVIFSESGDEGERIWRETLGLEQHDANGPFVMHEGRRYDIDLQRPLRDLRALSEELAIPLIAPKRVYQRIVYDGHPSREGNRNMALDIADFLTQWPGFRAGYEKRQTQAASRSRERP